eukprot:m.218712 g.218712  ORF g.218712 m.218712 type:complete len:60 (+) comp39903_c1_seq13:297-476(+)
MRIPVRILRRATCELPMHLAGVYACMKWHNFDEKEPSAGRIKIDKDSIVRNPGTPNVIP